MSRKRRKQGNKRQHVSSSTMEHTPRKLHVLLIYLVLAIATIIAFEQVRHSEFVYDDSVYITDNQHVNGGITRESVLWALTAIHRSNWHPLTWLSHMLDCELFGLNPLWHHLTNLLFHIANTLLLFAVLKRMTGALWRSAFVAALFALHPLHVESVAWVAERKDVLSGFFWMLTISVYIRYAERPGIGKYLLIFFLFGLGLMAKAMLVTLPFVLLLLDYWPLGRFQWEWQNGRKVSPPSKSINVSYQRSTVFYLIGEKIPLFILVVISSVVTFIAQKSGGAVDMMGIVPLDSRIANALVSYISYIRMMIYPNRLAVLYPHPGDKLTFWQPTVSVAVLVAITTGIIYLARRRHRFLAVGWLWYLGTLIPVIGLVQVGTQAMADRYTYLPSIGFFIMVTWGVTELLAKWRYLRIGLAISAGIAVCVLLIHTRAQVRYWHNEFTLFGHAIEVTEDNYSMHNNFGIALSEQGRFDEAVAHYRLALQIKPDHTNAHNNLGNALKSQGKLDEAASHFRQALRVKPDDIKAHNNLGSVLKSQGRLQEAINHYNHALQVNPDFVEARYNLGNALKSQGKLDEAIRHYRQALMLKPNYVEVHLNLGNTLKSQGKLDEAISHYRKALQINPNNALANNNLGYALGLQGRLDQAISHYRLALQINPDFVKAHTNLGNALQLQGKLNEAIREYRLALQIDPSNSTARKMLEAALGRRSGVSP